MRQDQKIQTRFEHFAAKSPEKVAISTESKVFTFGEMNAYGNMIARELFQKGIKPGSSVAICLKKRAEFLICALGVWKAGCVVCPILPNQKPNLLNRKLHELNASCVITSKATSSFFKFSQHNKLEVSQSFFRDRTFSQTNPKAEMTTSAAIRIFSEEEGHFNEHTHKEVIENAEKLYERLKQDKEHRIHALSQPMEFINFLNYAVAPLIFGGQMTHASYAQFRFDFECDITVSDDNTLIYA